MKQFKLLSVFAILILFVFSCNKTPHDKISGKWDVVKIENSTMTEESDIKFLDEMNSEVIENEIFEFKSEKISKLTPEAVEGSWEMDEAGTVLTIDWGESDMYSPHTFNIKTLTKDTLVFEEDFEEFFIKTYFVKVK